MFTHKDIEYRTIFVINCLEKRQLRVSNGELLLEEESEDGNKTLTKMPFQKILMLFIVGHISITTPLIDKCKKFNVALVVANLNLRPVFYWADSAEGNFLLRQRQYEMDRNDTSIAKKLVKNKVENQLSLLRKTRMKDDITQKSMSICEEVVAVIDSQTDYNTLMGRSDVLLTIL